MSLPPGHVAVAPPRIGVLLVNLGTPDAPDPPAVRRYLREFLSDRRVVELPALLWQPILRGIILVTRPKKSAHAYRQIWTDKGSPLAVHMAALADGLNGRWGPEVIVDWAMRYGNPSIASRIAALKEQGCTRILFAPLYPQYCGATTASAQDALGAALAGIRWQPAVRTLPPYHDDPAYITALADSARTQLAALAEPPQALLLSFHGMPERTLRHGDPYHCHCRKTARLLAEALGDAFSGRVEVSFQSRFGRAKWLEPSTGDMLVRLAGEGVSSLAVMAPGFSVDCLETLEEIMLRGHAAFLRSGGRNLAYFPCLNATMGAIGLYSSILGRELSGWLTPTG